MSQAADLRELSELIEQSALKIRVAAKRAGFSDKAAWRAADVIGMGTNLALGGNTAEAYEFAVSDLFEPEERRDIGEADFQSVDKHMMALCGYLQRLPADDGWRVRPKRKFVDWPENNRPKFRLRSWSEVAHG